MISRIVVDDSLLTGMIQSRRLRAMFPEIEQYYARYMTKGANSGCPKCPHKAARNHDSLRELKTRLLNMSQPQIDQIKQIYDAQEFVFYVPGRNGMVKTVR